MNYFLHLRTKVMMSICLLLLASVLLLTYRAIHKNQKTLTVAQQLQSSQQLLGTLQGQVNTHFASKGFRISGLQWDAENTDPGTVKSVPGYPFRIAAASEPSFVGNNPDVQQYATSDAAAYVANTLRNQYGYSDQSPPTYDGPPASEQNEQSIVLVKDTDTCSMHWGLYNFTLSCGSTGIDQAIAAEDAPFMAQYAQVKHVSESNLIAVASSIKSKDPNAAHEVITPSESPGYDIAEVVVALKDGGGTQLALYYAKNGIWHFVTQHSDEWGFSCDDMKADPDARKALHDQVCYHYPDIGPSRLDSTRSALR